MAARILAINPNSDAACTVGIIAALAPFNRPGGPVFATIGLPDGPPAIASWQDWHSVALPLAALVQANPADAYLIACVSDPAIDLLRSRTTRPVLGAFRSAVATALARGERFGVVAFVDASKARQARILQAMGVEGRLAASIALDLPMADLTDPDACRARLAETCRALAAAGADTIILGCAGMAAHRGFAEAACGRPVIEPIAAAAALALACLPA